MKFSPLLLLLSHAFVVLGVQVREYNLTLEASWMAKGEMSLPDDCAWISLTLTDGNPRGVLTINGDTPGPLIWGDEGDTLRVTVTNKMFIEATMHW